ncbi:carboxylating nicotinate-nucleotide diphosphorylase [Bacillus infantis]|jgi:nicotinate-nucleotide pyrophosphorylase (carboxylating)|uniref:carboxylating nicotinate-nucleotide diphosphorylase n=1 Tax=Bacillus infantis TaxID=324767 RepID=UPI002155D203|nr:carboxylating nicotinate-nucleotide diphosphorylase [Bacillus infantis]MCR6612143.1 carboxylating nicotinate-nucleotide diphosphorylase [Bacillus infantis]
MNRLKLRLLLEQFFLEDIGDRDVSSELIFGEEEQGEIVFLAKEDGIFCGADILLTGFPLLDSTISVDVIAGDGGQIRAGQTLARVSGPVHSLLKGERVILNLLQRMSGIATSTNKAVQLMAGSRTRITDTRKTTPGLRMLEKYAVRTGGGFNHRYGLYDAVMIKDNHISFAGGISNAVEAVRSKLGHMVKIEVETETKEQVLEAVEAKADVIMFDNRSPEEIREWLPLVPEEITTEASGGITMETLAAYGETNVDYISLGFLTHSVKSLDISVKVKMLQEVKG